MNFQSSYNISVSQAHPSWLKTLSSVDAAKANNWPPQSGVSYDWTIPTNEVYYDPKGKFTERFAKERRSLDYNYHRSPAMVRQRLQDSILDRVVENDTIQSSQQERPWIVFSAGPMGVGKGYVLSKLHAAGLFPLEKFIKIDPDMIKNEIPEFSGYYQANPNTAATQLHRESTQMADILFQYALRAKVSMLVDGSLRDVEYHKQLFDKIRTEHPHYRIAILHVTAEPEMIRKRAHHRAERTGRAVPQDLLDASMEQVPKSVKLLSPMADVTYTISNNEGEPFHLYVCDSESQAAISSWGDFQRFWQEGEEEEKTEHDLDVSCDMANAWTDTEMQDTAREIWGKSYPNFCPRCALFCDGQCGICIHGRHTCACGICKDPSPIEAEPTLQ